MTPRRILFVYHRAFLPFEGRYLRIYNQAVALVARGWQVEVLACDRTGGLPAREERDGIRIERVQVARNGAAQGPASLLAMIRYMVVAYRHVRCCKPSVVECCNLDGALPVLLSARRTGLPCILDLCEPEYCLAWPRWLFPVVWCFRQAERWLARRYDAVVVHNQYQIRKFERASVRRIIQVGSYPRRMLEARSRANRSAGRVFTIGRIGSIYENNGIEELLAAFRQLRQLGQACGRDYRLLLAGRVFDSYASTFESLTAGSGPELQIEGLYTPEQLPELYDRIDLASLLYRRSDFFRHVTPTKLFEAMACGVPVVASDIGEVRQIVSATGCGIVVDEADAAGVAGAIHRFAAEPAVASRMGEAGRQAALQAYCFEAYEQGYLELCDGLAADAVRRGGEG